MTLAATPLTLDDLEAPAPIQPSVVARIRDSHHALARLLAEGRRPVDISLITGYDPSYISRMQSDPAFIELITHYREVVSEAYVDVHERIAGLASDTVQELHQRLIENPGEFSPAQLNEMAKTMLDRAGFGPTKTVNNNNLNANVPAEVLARVRAVQAGRQKGEVKKIGQVEENGAEAAQTDHHAGIGNDAGRAPLVHSEVPPARVEGPGAEVRTPLREATPE